MRICICFCIVEMIDEIRAGYMFRSGQRENAFFFIDNMAVGYINQLKGLRSSSL